MTNVFKWTPELIERLMRLHAEGLSSNQIGVELGITRNMVVGKLHREQIKRGQRQRVKQDATVAKRVYTKREVQTTLAKATFVLPALKLVPKPRTDLVSIVDCTGCKWPVAVDKKVIGGHGFCNRDRVDERYCEEHRLMSRATEAPTTWLRRSA